MITQLNWSKNNESIVQQKYKKNKDTEITPNTPGYGFGLGLGFSSLLSFVLPPN